MVVAPTATVVRTRIRCAMAWFRHGALMFSCAVRLVQLFLISLLIGFEHKGIGFSGECNFAKNFYASRTEAQRVP